VDTALGLLGFVGFVVAVICLAAGISWAVVKISPKPKTDTPTDPAAPPSS
jgi:hypothetical protein